MIPTSSFRLALLCLVLSSSSTLFAANSWWPFGPGGSPTLQVDNTPIKAEARPFTTFSPIVRKVAPSVVSIYTTKKVKAQDQRALPFFNDPFFRRFFSDPNDPNSDNGDTPNNDNNNKKRTPRRAPSLPDQTGLGSGVIISKDGFILTNTHVIDVADDIKVRLGLEKKEYTAKLVGKDPMTDVALIKIEADNLPVMTLADSDKAEVGDIVLAIGNPFGLTQTVTMGIVSATGRNDVNIEDYEDFIQTDASINPGNSGGALVDTEGRMIGMNTAIVGGRGGGNVGIGFAVPSNLARYIMESLLKSGRVIRGYLGVNITEVTLDLAKAFKLPEVTGALIEQVNPKTAAEEAGLKAGDVITEFNGRKINDFRALRLVVSQTPPGTKVSLKVWRDAKERSFDITLKELTKEALTGNTPNDAPGADDSGNTKNGSTLLPGVQVDDMNADARGQFRIPNDVTGAVIIEIDPDSTAARPGRDGLQLGDVVLEVDRKSVRTAKEAVAAAKSVSGPLLLRIWSHGVSRFVVINPDAN